MTNELIEAAAQARLKAYAPYSGFKVGAALRTAGGRIFTGCNIENSSYGLTVCAERVAIFKAVSVGETEYSQICVVTDTDDLTLPCGACRQVICEFCGDLPVIAANLKGVRKTYRSMELFPQPFDFRKQLKPAE